MATTVVIYHLWLITIVQCLVEMVISDYVNIIEQKMLQFLAFFFALHAHHLYC